MTFRKIALTILPLAVAGGVAWLWFGKSGTIPAVLELCISSLTPAKRPPDNNPAPMPVGHHKILPPSPQALAAPFVAPARISSSVAPGAPLVRTVATASPKITGPLERAADLPSRPEPQPEARAELERVRFMLRDFQTRMGENPVGSNAEIMRAAMGGNSAGAVLGPPAGLNLNPEGELLDRWGTPYFFHQLSKNSMEIRSAGQDRGLWTADDLVIK